MQAYRALFMKWYPDKHSPAPSPKQEVEPKLKPVTETYEVKCIHTDVNQTITMNPIVCFFFFLLILGH